MLGEAWQSVQCLLLWMSFDKTLAAELTPALQILQRTLPRTKLVIWTLEDASDSVALRHPDPFDAAIILTLPQQSPYARAYLCYLAGIPIRVGQSCEFGGSVLSHSLQPPPDPVSFYDYQLHLLRSLGFPVDCLISEHSRLRFSYAL